MANLGPKDGGTVRSSLYAMRQERTRLTQLCVPFSQQSFANR